MSKPFTTRPRRWRCQRWLTVAIFAALMSARAYDVAGAEREPLVVQTEGGDRVFLVEIADDPYERSIGLSGRHELDESHGMLFLFDAPQESAFWMRNTFISLDILFIDAEGRVHRIEEYAVPLSDTRIPSNGPIVAVLEIGAGLSRRYGIVTGSQVIHPALPN